MISLSKQAEPVRKTLHLRLLAGDRSSMDETTFQVLKESNRRADQKSFVLVQASEGPSGQRITVFHYEKSRAKDSIAEYLKGFKGSLLTDGLAVYQSYCQQHSNISHGGCWSHARRRFTDGLKGKKSRNSIAKDFILQIKDLFAVEDKLKNLSDIERVKARNTDSRPIIVKIKNLLTEKINSYPKKSLTGKPLNYLDSQWDHLTRFLDDPRLVIHNNYVERQIKPFVVGRKEWLFADSEDGAHDSAIFYTLINTAQQNGLHPYEYICKLLRGLAQDEPAQNLLPFA